MDNHKIVVEQLNLVALVALWVAAKIEDCEPNIPKAFELNGLIQNRFPNNFFKYVEHMIVKFFEFKFNIPTAATYLDYWVEAVVLPDDYKLLQENVSTINPYNSFMDLKKNVADLVIEFLEITLLDIKLVQAVPSKLAAACLVAARYTAKINIYWPKHLIELTKYIYDEINDCFIQLIIARENITVGKKAKQETPDSGYLSQTNWDVSSDEDYEIYNNFLDVMASDEE